MKKEVNLTVVTMIICLCKMKHILIETEDHDERDREFGFNYNDYKEYNYLYNDYNAGSMIFSNKYLLLISVTMNINFFVGMLVCLWLKKIFWCTEMWGLHFFSIIKKKEKHSKILTLFSYN